MSYKEKILAALQAFQEPNRRREYFSLYSQDVRFHGYEGLQAGLESVKEYYESFWLAFPDARVLVNDCIESGDRVALRYEVVGTHTGSYLGVRPTGRQVRLPGISIFRFSEGLCVERWIATDALSLIRQLGLDPMLAKH